MSVLDEIVAHKRRELAQRKQTVSEARLERRLGSAPPVRDFAAALLDKPAVAPPASRAVPGPGSPATIKLIAEVKKASPSAGTIREDFDPPSIARTYTQHGAGAVSVLTDEKFFQGRLEDLCAVREAVEVPVLRKDFLLDRYQLLEARAAGADAVLLIAEVLDQSSLTELLKEAHALGMAALVELYEPDNLPAVLESGARVVGINNRNLRTFTTDLEHTLRLRERIPSDRILVAESGIRTRRDVLRLQEAGVHAILVGETLMRSRDIGAKIDELMQDSQ